MTRRILTILALFVAPACAVATVDEDAPRREDDSSDDDSDDITTGGTGGGDLVGGGNTTGSGSATSGGGSGGGTGGSGGGSGGATGGSTSGGGGTSVGTGSCADIPLFASWTVSDQYAAATCNGGTPCTQGSGTAGQQYKFECTASHKPNCQGENPGTTNWGDPPWTLIEACE